MFIYSFRASTLRFFAVVGLAAAALVALIVFVPAYEGGSYPSGATDAALKVNFDGIKTNEDRIGFLEQFGYTVSPDPVETVDVVVPSDFDRVFSGYNELQKAQGLDLAKYKGKNVTRYTYNVTNYPEDANPSGGKVWANLVIWRGKVIAGDICSADPAGFIHGFEK